MVRQYQEENVYEALQKRLHFLFQELIDDENNQAMEQ